MKSEVNKHQQAAIATKQKILQASRSLFVRSGFSGTSIGDIAKQAGINQSLVYHYFESKADLWRQVKVELIESLDSGSGSLESSHLSSLGELLERLVKTRFQIYVEQPDIVRMLLWQFLEDEQRTLLSGPACNWIEKWLAEIAQMQERGLIARRLSAMQILMLFNGVIWGPWLMGGVMISEVEASGYSESMLEELRRILNPELSDSELRDSKI